MPSKRTVKKAKEDLRKGKSPSTAAGEFVREEIHHVRQGKHGARSAKQVIAIGLSKARRAGVPLKPPKSRSVPAKTRRSAELAYESGQGVRTPRAPSAKRSRAMRTKLERMGKSAASHQALSTQAKRVAAQRRRHNRRPRSSTGG